MWGYPVLLFFFLISSDSALFGHSGEAETKWNPDCGGMETIIGKRPQTVCFRKWRVKSREEKQKRRHESIGIFRCGHGTELCSRVFWVPKRRICVRLSVQGAYRRSPQKIFARDLKGRSLFKLFKVSRKDVWGRPMLSSPGLCTRSP